MRRSWRPNRNCNILTPTLMAVSVVSFSFSRAAQPEAQGLSFLLSAGFLNHILSPTSLRYYWGPRRPLRPGVAFPNTFYQQLLWSPTHQGLQGPLRPGVAFPTTSYQQLLWTPIHQGLQGSPPPGFLYHILSATSLDPISNRGPKGPSAGLSLPHLISNFSGPHLKQGPQGSPLPGFPYHILSTTSPDANSIGGPEGPFSLAWPGFPNHISSLTPTV